MNSVRKLGVIAVAFSGVVINAVYSVDLLGAYFDPHYTEAVKEIVISAVVLEIGWLGLLVWVMVNPFERRHVLLFTMVPILLGNFLHSLDHFQANNGNLSEIFLNTLFGVLYAGLYGLAFLVGKAEEKRIQK